MIAVIGLVTVTPSRAREKESFQEEVLLTMWGRKALGRGTGCEQVEVTAQFRTEETRRVGRVWRCFGDLRRLKAPFRERRPQGLWLGVTFCSVTGVHRALRATPWV